MPRQPAWLKDLGNTANGVFAVDQNQRILTWNNAAEKLFGRSAAETVGRYCHEVVDGRLRSGKRFCCTDCKVGRCVRRGAVLHPFDLLTTTDGGEDIWVNVSITGLETKVGPLALHTVRRAEQRDRSEDALEEILGTLKDLRPGKARQGRSTSQL